MKIWLIEKAWVDSMENEVHGSRGYSPHGFVTSKQEADKIVEFGERSDNRLHGWACGSKGIPLYKSTEINELEAVSK